MTENTVSPLNNVITIDDERIKSPLDRAVHGSVEETLNALLNIEAVGYGNAKRCERSESRGDTRAGHYERKLQRTTVMEPETAKRTATRPPELAGPRPPAKPLSFFAALRAMNDNPLATIPVMAYELPIWEAKSVFGTQLLVSDPASIKRILLDNVANYAKTALDVRILSTAFGDGLLTSDGDKWRAHRRVMSPSFDYRSIASYAPVIVDAAEARLKAWDAKGENAEIDIAREMVTLTLEVISRTMFSADSDALGSRLEETIRRG